MCNFGQKIELMWGQLKLLPLKESISVKKWEMAARLPFPAKSAFRLKFLYIFSGFNVTIIMLKSTS